MPNSPFPMPPRLANTSIAPPRPCMPAIGPPPWPFTLPPGMRPLGPPPNPAAMTTLMTFRPPPGIMPPGVPPPTTVSNTSVEK